MNTINKIKNNYYDLNEFTEEQINFIKGLVILSYNDGYSEGEKKIKDIIFSAIESNCSSKLLNPQPHVCRYSKAMNQPYPRLCVDCGKPENTK